MIKISSFFFLSLSLPFVFLNQLNCSQQYVTKNQYVYELFQQQPTRKKEREKKLSDIYSRNVVVVVHSQMPSTKFN